MLNVSRRQACLLIGAAPLALGAVASSLAPVQARAEEATLAALESAQEQYWAVEAQLNELAAQQEWLSIELSHTMDAMEAKRAEIAQTQADITAAQAELQTAQDQLAIYVADGYKYGNTTVLDVLFSAATYEELFANLYYLGKVNDSTAELIANIKALKAQLEEQELQLQAQYAELEALKAQQESQLAEIEAAQTATYWLLCDLDAEVQALTEQYNQELIAQAEAAAEAERLRQEQEAAAAAGGGAIYGSGSASDVVNACYSTPSPGAGWCAAWVTSVFRNAGVGTWYGDACDMYSSWCYTSDRGSLCTGMIVAVSTHTATLAGRIYGHIGIYIGGGMVMDNIGYIRTIDIDSWIAFYGDTVTPRWGWLGGVALY